MQDVFHKIAFLAVLNFCPSSKIDFWTGKKFKTAKNAISWKKIWFNWFHKFFFARTFLNFMARCAKEKFREIKITFTKFKMNCYTFQKLIIQSIGTIELQNQMSSKNMFDTMNHIFCFWLSQFHRLAWLEQWSKLSNFRDCSKLFNKHIVPFDEKKYIRIWIFLTKKQNNIIFSKLAL